MSFARRRRFIVSLAAVALVVGLFVPATLSAQPNSVVGASILTEGLPRGYYITAVVIEFDKQIDLRGTTVQTSAFQVMGMRTSPDTSVLPSDPEPLKRTVVSAYSNSVPARAAVGADGLSIVPPVAAKGKYLVVEFDPNDPNSRALRSGLAYTLNYSVAWGDLLNKLGRVEVQASAVPTITHQVSPVIDDFIADSFTSGATTLKYRFFKPVPYLRAPKNPGHKYPLVLFLHGAGEKGDNNIAQIVAGMGATVWASPEFQAAHPAFVLAPQSSLNTEFAEPITRDAVMALVLSLMDQYPIDPKRVYVQGLSMGCSGTNALVNAYPEIWAGAIFIAGGRALYSPAAMAVPAWMATSVDDGAYVRAMELYNSYIEAGVSVAQATWPGNLYETAAPFAEALIVVAEAQGSHVLFTTYATGTNVNNQPHNTGWIATYSNPVIREWLFSQRRP